jgi:hypothetical protein
MDSQYVVKQKGFASKLRQIVQLQENAARTVSVEEESNVVTRDV